MANDAPVKNTDTTKNADKEAQDSSTKFAREAQAAQKDGGFKSATSSRPDTASQHLPPDFHIVSAGDAHSDQGFWSDLGHQAMLFSEGVASGSVGNIINGVRQIYDHATGTEYKPTELFDNQKEVDSSIAGRIGSAVGVGLDFAVATGGIGLGLGAIGFAGAGEGLVAAGAAGALEGGILTPSDDKNFVEGRLLNAGIGGAVGAIGFGAGAGVDALAKSVESTAGAAAVSVGGGIGVGAVIGAGAAEATSFATTGHGASAEQLELAAGIGAAGGALGAFRIGAKKTNEATETDKTKNNNPPPKNNGPLPDAKIIDGMKAGPIKFADKSPDADPRNTVSGSVEIDGHQQDVIMRAEHRPLDVTAQKFHKLTGFDTTIPRTTTRSVDSLGPEGKEQFRDAKSVDVQERAGRLLGDLQKDGTIKENNEQLAQRVRNMSENGTNDQLAQQLEQAIAERTIIGDYDMDGFNNITLSKENGLWKAGNIDFTRDTEAFSTGHTPWANSPLSDMPISKGTLAKIDTLVNRLQTPEGQKSLAEMGLTKEQSDALISRAQYLLTNKKFPPPTNYEDE